MLTQVFLLGTTVDRINTAWKVSKYRVFSGPYFPVFGLNTEIYSNLRIQSEYRKIRIRKNSVFGRFSRSATASTSTIGAYLKILVLPLVKVSSVCWKASSDFSLSLNNCLLYWFLFLSCFRPLRHADSCIITS